MNKKIIMASAASAVLAAVPMIGTFATDGDVAEVTDTINLTVNESSTLGVEATGATANLGTVTGKTTTALEADGSTFKIVCNGGNGWTLTAKGAGEASHETDLWNSDANHAIVTGTTLDGSASNWAFKLTGTGVTGGYNEYKGVPGTADTTVAEQTTAIAEDTISVKYTVAVGGDAPSGTYTGKVTYTLAAKAGDGA